jgi:hypothetical protein
MSRGLIVVGLLTLVVGIGGAGYGVWTIWQQHRMITSARPVTARIVGHQTEDLKASGFVAKVPLVQYEYTVDQKSYTSQKVTPAEFMLPDTWAESVFEQFPVGAEVEARYDPGSPDKAFLIAKYSAKPYLPLFVSLVIAAMGLGVVCEQLMNRDTARLEPTASGGIALRATQHHLTRARVMGIVGVIGLVCGAPAIIHHLSVSTTPHERMGFLLEGAYAVAVLTVLFRSAQQYRQGAGFGTPVVTMDRPPTIGEPLQLELSLPTRFTGVATLNASVKCEAKDTRFFNTSEENLNTVLVDLTVVSVPASPVTRGGRIAGAANLVVPPDSPPTTPVEYRDRMQVVWSLIVTAHGNNGRRAETEFILPVQKAAS